MNHNVMMAQAQAQAQVFQTRALPKKTDNAPQYDGKLKDDLELYLFATEKFYSEFRDLMNANTSESVDMIFCNFGPVVRTFLREVSHSLTRVDGIRDPLTWALCKDRLRPRFRDEHVIPSFNGRTTVSSSFPRRSCFTMRAIGMPPIAVDLGVVPRALDDLALPQQPPVL
ncbi:hypothetical protein PF005_g14195 [Phytophthora fragariae]|uniref:Uncharacterized protein n=1 Tax=Phytophthora fragariae TaxID=53985 RepID=A0A6A3XIY1_9STRA|nr:hypothetical protein PF009_g4713 [Phytophthora fragariae]KAE9141213.1 hypothetical protein PF006_g13315 [Phytophthora fragariae]KAE9203443.1 hypothetical protein PF005_g14195 [Phytophthora fragariae]KAE9219080.1 hypothetical protein PF002_g16299 [Phytophthora fragariae]